MKRGDDVGGAPRRVAGSIFALAGKVHYFAKVKVSRIQKPV